MGYLRFLSNQLTVVPNLYRSSIAVSVSRDLTLEDSGKFLICNGAATITLTLPAISWATDTEIEILHWSSNSVSILATGITTITRFGGTTHQIAGKGCCAVLKLISANNWVLFGGFL
jgi:hypothetical protein